MADEEASLLAELKYLTSKSNILRMSRIFSLRWLDIAVGNDVDYDWPELVHAFPHTFLLK